VGNWNQGIWKYDKDGNCLVKFGQKWDFDQPSDLAFGSDNALYVVDRHHSLIKVFTPPYASHACVGFESPMANYPVSVKKNRALPLRAEVYSADSVALTDADLGSPPVVQIWFEGGGRDLHRNDGQR